MIKKKKTNKYIILVNQIEKLMDAEEYKKDLDYAIKKVNEAYKGIKTLPREDQEYLEMVAYTLNKEKQNQWI